MKFAFGMGSNVYQTREVHVEKEPVKMGTPQLDYIEVIRYQITTTVKGEIREKLVLYKDRDGNWINIADNPHVDPIILDCIISDIDKEEAKLDPPPTPIE